MNIDQIDKAKEFLENQDWTDVTPDKLIRTLEELVENFCDLRNPIKKTIEGSSFKSKNKIPRLVRKWLRKKNLASKAIKKVTTVKGCRRLKEIIEKAEMEISKAAFSRKLNRENKAIIKMEKKS